MSALARSARSLQYLAARYLLRRKYLTARACLFDLKFKFRIEDAGGRQIFKKGIYEEDLTRFLLDALPRSIGENGVIFDVGANLGWYSILLDKALDRNVRILALEPDPENFELLSSNLELNRSARVLPLAVAASDVEEEKILYQYPKKNVGRHSLLAINPQPGPRVRCVPLDRIVRERRIDPAAVQFVKIDVEGYELFVLRGMDSILDCCPLILAEFSPEYMRKGGLEPADALDLLYRRGYRPWILEGAGLMETDRTSLLKASRNRNVFWKKGTRRDELRSQ